MCPQMRFYPIDCATNTVSSRVGQRQMIRSLCIAFDEVIDLLLLGLADRTQGPGRDRERGG